MSEEYFFSFQKSVSAWTKKIHLSNQSALQHTCIIQNRENKIQATLNVYGVHRRYLSTMIWMFVCVFFDGRLRAASAIWLTKNAWHTKLARIPVADCMQHIYRIEFTYLTKRRCSTVFRLYQYKWCIKSASTSFETKMQPNIHSSISIDSLYALSCIFYLFFMNISSIVSFFGIVVLCSLFHEKSVHLLLQHSPATQLMYEKLLAKKEKEMVEWIGNKKESNRIRLKTMHYHVTW